VAQMGRGDGELGEHEQLDREERPVALHGHVHHLEHARDVGGEGTARRRVLTIHLAGGGVVAIEDRRGGSVAWRPMAKCEARGTRAGGGAGHARSAADQGTSTPR